MESYLEYGDVKNLVRGCMKIRRGERVYLGGNVYGVAFLDSVLQAMREAGAKVTTQYWTDESVVTDLLQGNHASVKYRWMPKRVKGKTFEIPGVGRKSFDKIVTLFSGITEQPAVALAASRGKEGKGILAGFKAMSRLDSGHRDASSGLGTVPYVLLDLPSRPVVEAAKLKFGTVLKAYRRALTQDLGEIRKLNRTAGRFFRGKEEVRVTCPRGTDFRFRLSSYPWQYEDLRLGPDRLVQLPGGEAYVVPDTPTGEGVVVTRPPGFERRLTIRKGIAVAIHDRKGNRWVRGTPRLSPPARSTRRLTGRFTSASGGTPSSGAPSAAGGTSTSSWRTRGSRATGRSSPKGGGGGSEAGPLRVGRKSRTETSLRTD
ncbi:MAG: M29 family metallopeptidase [Planctomycetota bacterium]